MHSILPKTEMHFHVSHTGIAIGFFSNDEWNLRFGKPGVWDSMKMSATKVGVILRGIAWRESCHQGSNLLVHAALATYGDGRGKQGTPTATGADCQTPSPNTDHPPRNGLPLTLRQSCPESVGCPSRAASWAAHLQPSARGPRRRCGPTARAE